MSKKSIATTDFRTGNLLYWQSSEDGLLPSKMDWQDLKILEEAPVHFWEGHSTIPVNDDVLTCVKYISFENNGYYGIYKIMSGDWGLYEFLNDSNGFHFINHNSSISKSFEWLHEFQNHFYCTTGEELIIDLARLELIANKKEVDKIDLEDAYNLPF